MTLAVTSFFVASIIGRQIIDDDIKTDGFFAYADIYLPLRTVLQFFFYMGALKVSHFTLHILLLPIWMDSIVVSSQVSYQNKKRHLLF